jgi:hypothetical protein
MQPQLIHRDGTASTLTEEQYQQVLDALGLEEHNAYSEPPMSDEEIDALLDELAGVSADWGFSTDDLLEERRKERELEQEREKRHGI